MAKADYTVRAIGRGLEVLQAVNRYGVARYVDIANSTSIPYPTVCRIVGTLVDLGMLERMPDGFGYRPTAMVQSLSAGFEEEDSLVRSTRPIISALCEDVGWPITITTRVGASMIIRDSTHKQTTLTYNHYSPGYALPLLECSVGKAYLAFCSLQERKSIVATIKKIREINPTAQLLLQDVDAFLKPFQESGYAYHSYNEHTKDPGKTSSLAVPVFVDGVLKAAMGLIYFSSAIGNAEAAKKYVRQMQAAAKDIEKIYLKSCSS